MKINFLMMICVLSFSVFAESKIAVKTQKINKVEFVAPQTTMKEVEVTRTSFHGKKLKRKYDEKINKKINMKAINAYMLQIQDHLNLTLPKINSSKYKPFMVKIQIQKNGLTDILFIDSQNQKANAYVYESFKQAGELLPIPKETGQSEIQLKLFFM